MVNVSFQPYKYNGKELDLMHGLNTYDYGARQYSPVLARWDRKDPLCEKYYSISPYAYCGNNPVNAIDPDGRYITYQNGNKSYIYYKGDFYENKRKKDGNGNWIITGAKVKPTFDHMSRTLNALRKMDNSENPTIKKVFDAVSDLNDSYEHRIQRSLTNKSHTEPVDCWQSDIYISFYYVENYKEQGDFENVGLTDYELIGHELKHSFDNKQSKNSNDVDKTSGIEMDEIEAVVFENLIRVEEGKDIRTKYGNDIPKEYLK